MSLVCRTLGRIVLIAAGARWHAETLAAQAPLASVPWRVAVTTSTPALKVGTCSAVYIALTDASGKDVPRNSKGMRIGLADFDLTASGADGRSVVGTYNGSSNYSVCACLAATAGSEAVITATYPAASAVQNGTRVEGVAFQSSVTVPVVESRGFSDPPGCTRSSARASSSSAAIMGPSTGGTSITPVGGTPIATLASGSPLPPIGLVRDASSGSPTAAALLTIGGTSFPVRHVAGGSLASGMALRKSGTERATRRAGTAAVDPLVMDVVPSADVASLVNSSWDGTAVSKSGTLFLHPERFSSPSPQDFAIGHLAFTDAAIVSVAFPAIELFSGKSRGQIRLVFAPRTVARPSAPPSSAALQAISTSTKATGWLTGNTLFKVGTLESNSVQSIEPFTVGAEVIVDGNGVHSVASPAGGPPAIPNLFVTLDAKTSPGWIAWYEDFVLKGNSGTAKEKSLTLELRGVNGVPLMTLIGHGVGIVSLRAREQSDSIRLSLLAELYVTRLELVGPGAVPAPP